MIFKMTKIIRSIAIFLVLVLQARISFNIINRDQPLVDAHRDRCFNKIEGECIVDLAFNDNSKGESHIDEATQSVRGIMYGDFTLYSR